MHCYTFYYQKNSLFHYSLKLSIYSYFHIFKKLVLTRFCRSLSRSSVKNFSFTNGRFFLNYGEMEKYTPFHNLLFPTCCQCAMMSIPWEWLHGRGNPLILKIVWTAVLFWKVGNLYVVILLYCGIYYIADIIL